jgi:hypothetical protein
LTRK